MTESKTNNAELPTRPVLTEDDVRKIYAYSRPDRKLLTLWLLRSLVTGPGFPFVFGYFYIIFRTLRYRFTDEGVTKTWGRFWRKEIYLTYRRIQDIHISRGIFHRWLGLATIHVQTASGKSEPEISIEGILEYEKLRDFLYSKMRGGGVTSDAGATETEESSAAGGELILLLEDIRNEIRGIRETIEKNR